jgi:hypothetical protein
LRHKRTNLETELRANRPQPSDELVHRLEGRVREGRRSRAGSFRVAFAGALAAGVLAALASVGGLGYAAIATGEAVDRAKKVVKSSHGTLVVRKSPSRDQYGKPKVKKKKKAKKKAKGRAFARPPFTG